MEKIPIGVNKMFLYELQLIEGKYYIGITSNIDKRLKQHFSGKGSYWTRKYSVIKVINVIDAGNISYESIYPYENFKTLEYVEKYGIENVRGGAWAHPNDLVSLNVIRKTWQTAEYKPRRKLKPKVIRKLKPKVNIIFELEKLKDFGISIDKSNQNELKIIIHEGLSYPATAKNIKFILKEINEKSRFESLLEKYASASLCETSAFPKSSKKIAC